MTDAQSPAALATELGHRLKTYRLNANMTQAELATLAGVNRNTVMNAESGKAHLESFIAILQALGLAAQLDLMLPAPAISPLQLMKLQGKQRKRASASARAEESKEGDTW